MTDRQIAQLLETALEHHRAGKLPEAEETYRQILAQRPAHFDSIHLLGVIAHQSGQHAIAVNLIQKALQLSPQLFGAWNNLGEALRALGRNKEATQCYQNALTLKPDFAEATSNLARAYDAQNMRPEAIDAWQRFLRLNPRHVEAYHHLASDLHSIGQEPQAIACWQKLLSIDPTFYKAYNDMGVIIGGRYLFEEAEKLFFESIRLEPSYAIAYYNLGVIYERQARYQDAMDRYRQSLSYDPAAPDPNLNLALMLLVTGDLPGGFKQYEWRWKLPRVIPLTKPFTQPEWRGQDVAGKTVLIHAEQGMGDTIQLARYCKMVKARGAYVKFMVQPPLIPLLQQVEGVDEILVDEPNPVVAFDVHIPSLSLPGVLGSTVETIPADVPYLKADPAKSAEWQKRLADDKNFRVGITWAGRPEHHNDHNRSTTLAMFAPLAKVPGVTFYSLQKGPAATQSLQPPEGMHLVNCDPALTDFSDSAGLLANLDLVISVDTSIVHLAGAMAREVWTLVPFVPDWRWLTDRPDSPWYPTMRLFRQKKLKEWAPVFEAVADELTKKVAGHRPR